jgi:hypothetical protein
VVLVALLSLAFVVWAPDIVTARLGYSTEQVLGQPVDARARLNQLIRENVGDYFWDGVGAGNYHTDYAFTHGFSAQGKVIGTHNVFTQVTVFWGITGLAALVVLTLSVYRSIPKRPGADALKLTMRAIAVALLINMFATHSLEGKEFAFGLGLFAAGDIWIWAQGRRRSRLRQLVAASA